MDTFEALFERLIAWAKTQPDIRLVLLVGSRARTETPADEWSDADIVIMSTDPDRFLTATDWLGEFATPLLTFLEPTATGTGEERRVLFAGGLDVDFTPIPVSYVEQIAATGWPPETAVVVARGMRVLLDKDDLFATIAHQVLEFPEAAPPAQQQFLNLVNDFWYHAVWVAKKLRRGELWIARSCLDCYMKGQLRTMLEWHARATHGWSYDTWHDGRFLDRWADPRAVAELPGVFARYDVDDVRRALFATMRLFRWLASETAERLGYADATPAATHATAIVTQVLPEQR